MAPNGGLSGLNFGRGRSESSDASFFPWPFAVPTPTSSPSKGSSGQAAVDVGVGRLLSPLVTPAHPAVFVLMNTGQTWNPQALAAAGRESESEKLRLGSVSQTSWAQTPAPPGRSCVTLEKFLHLSVPQSPHLSAAQGGCED